jgi:hypothetical protein
MFLYTGGPAEARQKTQTPNTFCTNEEGLPKAGFTNTSRALGDTPDPDGGLRHQNARPRQRTQAPKTVCIKREACRRQALQIQADRPMLCQTQVEDAGTKHVRHYVGQPVEPRQKTQTPNTTPDPDRGRRHQTRCVLKMKTCRRHALQIQAEHPIARQTQTEEAGTKHGLH